MKKINDLLNRIFKAAPAAWYITFISAFVIILHLILRSEYKVMKFLTKKCIRPLQAWLTHISSGTDISIAEILIAAAGAVLILFIVISLLRLVFKDNRGKTLAKLFAVIIAFGSFVYAGFSVLWGTYYYGDDFITESGLKSLPVSIEELTQVTGYFASSANYYSELVERDGNGVCTVDRDSVLDRAETVYDVIATDFPVLNGENVRAKPVYFSSVLSSFDFTGFYFPFTGEANVNTDSPAADFPATVVHELAHQRGVAKEQEANFISVLVCMEYGDPEFCYSASLLAYTYLGNALYSADREAWNEIYSTLNNSVLADFRADREYWAQKEGAVKSVSNTVYDNFLKSYDQVLGLKSYGACVDLLVNYYYKAEDIS